MITLAKCLDRQTKKAPIKFHLCLEPFLFFSFFFFKSRCLITIITFPPTSPWTSSCSTTWIGPSYLVTHLDARISPNRFHQLVKTKLGLSISPFLVIDDNPLQRYSMKFSWIHVASSSILPCVKVMDNFHKP